MNLQKIGLFLKDLRKESGCTQEQLAEKLYVSRRTVSRWETGNNMPDLDLLIELADLYQVDLREILNGERKSERMNEELKETVLQVADYSNEEKKVLMRRMNKLFILGLVGTVLHLAIRLSGLEKTMPYEAISGFGLGVGGGMLILGVVFTSKYALKLKTFKMNLLRKMKGESK